jgi:hypothetical protein
MSSVEPKYATDLLVSLLDGLHASAIDPEISRRAADLRDRLLQRPMPKILDLVWGDTITEKARRCGVSRQTFHSWMNGARPNPRQAIRLAKLTDLSVAEIRGSSATTPAAARAARVR